MGVAVVDSIAYQTNTTIPITNFEKTVKIFDSSVRFFCIKY